MKNFFTSVMAALFMAAPVGNLSAQTSQQLTKSQEEAIKKELLPVVFEQIKEQAGIDILGWATPKLNANTLSGIPVLESSSLRAASTEGEAVVKPDSIIVNTTGISAEAGAFLGNLKVTFDGYHNKDIPLITVAGKPLSIDLPEAIVVSSGKMGEVAKITFKSEIVEPDNSLPFSLDVNISLFKGESKDLIDFSLAQDKQTLMLNGNLIIGDGLKDIFKIITAVKPDFPQLPDMNYLMQLDIAKMFSPTGLPATLYGVLPDENQVTLGKANVVLNFESPIFISQVDVTSYENGTANEWDRYTFELNQETEQDLVLGIDKYECEKDFSDAGKYSESTIITMSDYTKNITADTKSAISGIVTRVVNELANEGQASMYKMTIEQGNKHVENGLKTELEVEVAPYMSEDKKSAIAEIRINTYEDGTAISMLIKATADLSGSKKIAVDVIQGETSFATAYFTSNIAGVITSNESVQVSDVKVIPTANAIRVLNADKACYQIYSITGAMMANGTIAGDAYISTANLAKGIYIVVVEANGVKQSVKFIR